MRGTTPDSLEKHIKRLTPSHRVLFLPARLISRDFVIVAICGPVLTHARNWTSVFLVFGHFVFSSFCILENWSLASHQKRLCFVLRTV